MNKTIILIASFVTTQTMPMSWLMSKTNPISTKLALLNKIAFVKPHTTQTRPYFSKSIHYLGDWIEHLKKKEDKLEEEIGQSCKNSLLRPDQHLALLEDLFAKTEDCKNTRQFFEDEQKQLRQKNDCYNSLSATIINIGKNKDTREPSISTTLLDKIKEKSICYNEIQQNKAAINEKFVKLERMVQCKNNKDKNTSIFEIEKFKLPEE